MSAATPRDRRTPEADEAKPSAKQAPSPADEAARKRRVAEIFGDVLPDTTSDERDPGDDAPGRPGESASDEWLRRQVPPHHGS